MHLIVRCLVSICASVPPAPLYLIWTAFQIIFEKNLQFCNLRLLNNLFKLPELVWLYLSGE